MKTDTVYKGIRYVGLGLILLSLWWAFYKGTRSNVNPGGLPFSRAVSFYTDGNYEDDLHYYENSIREHPDFIHGNRGRASTGPQYRYAAGRE